MDKRSTIILFLSFVAGLAIFGGTGCADDVLFSISYNTEEFEQNARPEIDILWVVDNSRSMDRNQSGLGESFQSFINNLVETGVDYHIGVISTDTLDGGMLHTGANNVPYIQRDTIDPTGTFLQNVQVGVLGSATEKAFESAALTLGKGRSWQPGSTATPPNPGFLRTEAALFLIMVSNEDDKSFGPVDYYRKLFESYKGPGNENLISVSAIVGDPEVGCFEATRGSASPGDRFIKLASRTGGLFASICADFSDTLQELSINASGLRSRFELSSLPNTQASIPCEESLEAAAFCVRVNGSAVAKGNSRRGWMYDDNTNSIIFGANDVPPPQASITVEYQEFIR